MNSPIRKVAVKYVRFLDGGTPKFGVVQGDLVRPISGDPFGPYTMEDRAMSLGEVQLLAPCSPSKGIGIGLNYREHARELGEPVPAEPAFFFKPSTTIIGSDAQIVWPAMSERVDYEAELVVVIGRHTKNVEPQEALDCVLGYCCGNDVTARDLVQRDHGPNRGKAFDTFGAIGPWIITDLSPDDLSIECFLNGQLRQSGRTSDMVFGIPQLVSHLSKIMTLLPGDVVFTGTPFGIGPMQPGDTVEVRIEGIGTLRNSVVRPSQS